MKTWRFTIPVLVLLLSMLLPSASGFAQTPPPLPGQVMNLDVHGYSSGALLTWDPPAGLTPTGYRVTTYQQVGIVQKDFPEASVSFKLPTLATVTGLSAIRNYEFTVTPLFGAVAGVESALTRSIRPGVAGPSAPLNLQGAVAAGVVNVTWAYPAIAYVDHFLLQIYTSSGQMVTYKDPAATYHGAAKYAATITGLPSGTYLMDLRAIGSNGMMGAGVTLTLTVPQLAGTPAVVTDVRAVSGNGIATVSWLPPVSDGGAVITSYVVSTSSDPNNTSARKAIIHPATDGWMFGGGRWSVSIGGLTNGTAYSFYVFAINAVGPSAPALSNSVTPMGPVRAPDTVIDVRATFSNGQFTVSWLPAFDGGSSILAYLVTSTLDPNASQPLAIILPSQSASLFSAGRWTAPIDTHNITLTYGRAYTFYVFAINAVGFSQAAVSNTVTPALPARVPDPLWNVRAIAGNGSATVSWSPAYDGGSPITSYLVYTSPNSSNLSELKAIIHPSADWWMFSAGRWSVPISGLTNGRTYTFYVFAVNSVGMSQSAGANAITPATTPGMVTNLSVTPGDTSAVVKWDAPASDGGSALSGYEVTSSDGVHAAVVTRTQTTGAALTGLMSGTTYTISVVALNGMGRGSAAIVTVSLRNLAPTLAVPATQDVQYSDKLSFVVSATGPEASDHLVLTATGLPAGLSFADKGNGTGTVAGAVEAAPGNYTTTFSVSDGHNQTVSHRVSIVVKPEDAIVQPNPSMPIAVTVAKGKDVAKIVNVSAFIQEATDDSPGERATAVPVTIRLKAMGSGATVAHTTSVQMNGTARLLASASFKNLAPSVYRVIVEVGGTNYRGVGHSMITVSNPAQRGSIRGQGTMTSHGAPASFQFQVKRLANGNWRGSLTYIERHAAGDYTLKGNIIGGLVIRGHKAFFQARGTLNGADGYRFAVAIADNASGEGIDKLALWATGPNHELVDDCTFSATAVTGGDTVVSAR